MSSLQAQNNHHHMNNLQPDSMQACSTTRNQEVETLQRHSRVQPAVLWKTHAPRCCKQCWPQYILTAAASKPGKGQPRSLTKGRRKAFLHEKRPAAFRASCSCWGSPFLKLLLLGYKYTMTSIGHFIGSARLPMLGCSKHRRYC